MADIRTLKLALLADTKDYISKLDKADKETRSFSDKLGTALKAGALAFAAVGAAAGAMAIKIGKDAVAAAIEDQKSQEQLALALKNTTKATDAQIKANEKYITTAQNKFGIEDTKLRSSLATLTRATGDLTKAQEIQTLALDVSAATGNDLETVSLALAKAYNGNLGALTRLGIPLDANIIKTKDFNKAAEVLAKTFGGAAQANADTFAGRMEIMKRRIEDAQEAIGYALLPFLEQLSTFIGEKEVPFIERASEAFVEISKRVKFDFGDSLQSAQRIFEPVLYGLKTAFNTVQDAIERNREKLQPLFDLMKMLWEFTKTYLVPFLIKGLGDAFILVGNIIGGVIDFVGTLTQKINDVIQTIQKFIDKIQAAIDKAKELASRIGNAFTAPANPNLVVAGKGGVASIVINNNVSGAIDPQGTARTITKVTNQALATSGLRAFSAL